LGTIITAGQLSINPAKITAITDWPIPQKLRDVESFLGTMNFWRKFIKDFSTIARPLHELKKKNVPFVWTNNCQHAFATLKSAITSAPVLKTPNQDLPYLLETDASGFALGAVLSQPHDSKWHPIGYHSRTLSAAERNYPTHDLELLAIIDALKIWRHLLEGAKHNTLIRTDNLALKYFMSSRLLSRRQARWAEFLARFDFQIEYSPGSKNKADGLSRRPDLIPTMTGEIEDQILLPSNRFINAIISLAEPSFLERLRHRRPLLSSIDNKINDPKSGWTRTDGLVRDAGDRIIVPDDVSLRSEIIRLTHDAPHAGHPGIEKTLDLVKRNYYWVGITKDIAHYIKSCPVCQQTKSFPAKPAGLLQPLPPPSGPWEEITTDLLVELPDSQGYDTILVVVDRFTKRAHFIPTTTNLSAEGTARLFRDHVWKHHGWPKKIISDRGTQYAARFAIALNTLFGIQTGLSTAYHPETDGQTERLNQELELYLRLYTNFMQDDWLDWLATAEFAYNNRIHSSTDHSPFFLEYGRHPHVPLALPSVTTTNPAANEFANTLSQAREAATQALNRTAENMKKYADTRRRHSPSYYLGQKVWLDTRNINTGRPSKKLDVKRTGPFEILSEISPLTYKLKLPPSWKIHPVFHVSLLRPANIDEELHPRIVDDTLRPPPDIIEQEEEYEVESILEHRGGKRRREYLVKWFGYPMSETTWETKKNLRHAQDIVLNYESRLASNEL
jgi:transposase InsO family protein